MGTNLVTISWIVLSSLGILGFCSIGDSFNGFQFLFKKQSVLFIFIQVNRIVFLRWLKILI